MASSADEQDENKHLKKKKRKKKKKDSVPLSVVNNQNNKKTESVAEMDLDTLLTRRSELEANLAGLERQIFALETSYLQDTHSRGNIIRGWSGFLSSNKSGGIARKRVKFNTNDRLFSLSSITSDNYVVDPNAIPKSREPPPRVEKRVVKKQKQTRKGPGRPRKLG